MNKSDDDSDFDTRGRSARGTSHAPPFSSSLRGASHSDEPSSRYGSSALPRSTTAQSGGGRYNSKFADSDDDEPRGGGLAASRSVTRRPGLAPTTGGGRYNNNSDSDQEIRRPPTSLYGQSSLQRTPYGASSGARHNNSDSDNDRRPTHHGGAPSYGARGAGGRRNSDSDDDRGGYRPSALSNSSRFGERPQSSRRGGDHIDSYENSNQKLKEMIQYDKSICEELDGIYESKLAKEKQIERLKDDIQREANKEDSLRKKLSELRMSRKQLQARLDEYK